MSTILRSIDFIAVWPDVLLFFLLPSIINRFCVKAFDKMKIAMNSANERPTHTHATNCVDQSNRIVSNRDSLCIVDMINQMFIAYAYLFSSGFS